MTHEHESEFTEKVEEELESFFGEENVRREVYLPETWRFADFVVQTEFFGFVVEVENDWDSVFKGIGQATLYASHYPNCFPVVVLPEGHTESPEVEYFRRHIPIVEV